MNFEERAAAFITSTKDICECQLGLVTLDFAVGQEAITLEQIWSEAERGKGHASRAMRAVVALADDFDIELCGQAHWLTYDTEFGGYDEADLDGLDALNEMKLDNDALQAWYERLGFEVVGEGLGDGPLMVRRPVRHHAINMPGPQYT